METFYNGLNAQTKSIVDASANGALLRKSYNEAYEILELISINSHQWPTKRLSVNRIVVRVHELDAMTALIAQVSSLTNMIKFISLPVGTQSLQPE